MSDLTLRLQRDMRQLLVAGAGVREDDPLWEIAVPVPGGKVWSVNADRNASPLNMWKHQKATGRAVREALTRKRVPKHERIVVWVSVYLRQWRRADPQNYLGGSTIKAALDALTNERRLLSKRPRKFVTIPNGVVPDDKPEHMVILGPDLYPLADAPPATCRGPEGAAFYPVDLSGPSPDKPVPTIVLAIAPARKEPSDA